MKEKNKIILVITIVVLIIIAAIFLWFRQSENKSAIENQTIEIKQKLSQLETFYDGCVDLTLNKDFESKTRCLSSWQFVDWTRNFVAQPELSNVKQKLLDLANSVEEMRDIIAINKDYNSEFAKNIIRKISQQISAVKEEILKIK